MLKVAEIPTRRTGASRVYLKHLGSVHSLLAWCLLAAAAFAVLALRVKYPLVVYDEGFADYNAFSVLHGAMPYRDFWTAYPLGQSYTIAAFFQAFGESLLVARLYGVFVRWLIVLAMFLLARQVMGPRTALAFATIATVLLARLVLFSYALLPALMLGMFALLACLAYQERKGLHWAAAAGLCIGLAAIYRWDVAAYAAAAVGCGLMMQPADGLQVSIRPNHFLASTRNRARLWLAAPATMLATAGIVAGPVYGYWLLIGGARNVFEQLFVFPVLGMPEFRRLPLPALLPWEHATQATLSLRLRYLQASDWLAFYGTLAIYAVAALALLSTALRTNGRLNRHQQRLLPIAIFGLLLFAQAINRYDPLHVLPTVLMGLIVLFAVLQEHIATARGMVECWFPPILAAALLIFYLAPSVTLIGGLAAYPPWGCYSHLERAGCVAVNPDQERAVDYLLAHTDEDERIFVGNTRHDNVLINDMALYFLAGRRSATQYADLHPGVITTAAVQSTVTADLSRQRVRTVVLVDMPPSTEPNASSISSNVTLLDTNLRAHFQPVASFGIYEVRQARTTALP